VCFLAISHFWRRESTLRGSAGSILEGIGWQWTVVFRFPRGSHSWNEKRDPVSQTWDTLLKRASRLIPDQSLCLVNKIEVQIPEAAENLCIIEQKVKKNSKLGSTGLFWSKIFYCARGQTALLDEKMVSSVNLDATGEKRAKVHNWETQRHIVTWWVGMLPRSWEHSLLGRNS